MISIRHENGKLACAIHATNGFIRAIEIKLGDCITTIIINADLTFHTESVKYPLRE